MLPDPNVSAMADSLSPATRAVHAGRPPHEPGEPMNLPIPTTSMYVGGGEREYGRTGNEVWEALEEAIGALEGGRALSFASGSAAMTAVLDLVDRESVVVCGQAYQGTLGMLADLEARGRLRTRLVDIADTGAVRAALDDETALLWIESPTNPGMAVADLPALIAAAHEAGARVVVDNTFATPLLQQPLALGADLVIHSVSKFLSGHSDLILGALVTAPTADGDRVFEVLQTRRTLYGAIPGPFEAWLALRGLRTLAVRMERSCASAATLAQRLREHPAVAEVRYPGTGAVLAVVLPDAERAEAFTHATRLWTHATSLGGVESTLERRRRWPTESPDVPEGLVRLSVGIEDVEDLWADLSQALDHL